MSWQPIEPELFQLPDTAVNLDYLMVYEMQDGETLQGYTWSLFPASPNPFTLTATEAGVRLQAASLSGLFKPDFLDYRDGDDVLRVSDWPELPPCKDLVEFKPSRRSQWNYTLTVTATLNTINAETSEGESVDRSQNWALTILHDYSSGKQKLLEYMQCQP